MICLILTIVFTTVRTMKLFDDQDPFFSSTTKVNYDQIDLFELGFTFAVGDIDPTVGTWFALHAVWNPH